MRASSLGVPWAMGGCSECAVTPLEPAVCVVAQSEAAGYSGGLSMPSCNASPTERWQSRAWAPPLQPSESKVVAGVQSNGGPLTAVGEHARASAVRLWADRGGWLQWRALDPIQGFPSLLVHERAVRLALAAAFNGLLVQDPPAGAARRQATGWLCSCRRSPQCNCCARQQIEEPLTASAKGT